MQEISSKVKVFVCAGDQDPNSIFVQPFADLIPNTITKSFENEGHLSVIINHAEEIMFTVLNG